MRLLLDTNIIIFWLNADKRINERLIEIISDAENICYVSVASIWEIEIKASLGKLRIPKNYVFEINKQNFIELPITFTHAEAIKTLPTHHKDPFDRLIITQAIIEKLTIITFDENYKKYLVKILQ